MASISSKKMRQAFLVLAISNSSRTILAPWRRVQEGKVSVLTFISIQVLNRFSFLDTHLSHVFLHQLRSDDSDEAGVCAVGYGSGAQSLSGAGGPEQQHTFRRLDTQIDESLGLVREIGGECD